MRASLSKEHRNERDKTEFEAKQRVLGHRGLNDWPKVTHRVCCRDGKMSTNIKTIRDGEG